MCLKESYLPDCWKVLNMTKLDLSKASYRDSTPEVVVKYCEPELSYILPELFNMCLRRSCFPDCSKVLYVVVSFQSVKGRVMAKKLLLR